MHLIPERPRLRPIRGFTLIELMIVLAIIGMLVGLLLPAVQSARESSRRMHSANNLKQMGLALLNYESALSCLPPGYISDRRFGFSTESLDAPPGWAWGALLLPFMEHNTLADSIDYGLPAWHPRNAELVRTTISTFQNPAAVNYSGAISVRNTSGDQIAILGRSHYVANVGNDEPWSYRPALDNWTNQASGPFYRNSRVRLREIRDGLSNTVMVGEHTTVSEKTWTAVVPDAVSCPIDPNRHPFTQCDYAATLVLAHSGPSAAEPGVIHPPSFPTSHVCQMFAPWAARGGFVLMGDGSVRFIPTTVNVDTWAGLCTIAGAEIFHDEL